MLRNEWLAYTIKQELCLFPLVAFSSQWYCSLVCAEIQPASLNPYPNLCTTLGKALLYAGRIEREKCKSGCHQHTEVIGTHPSLPTLLPTSLLLKM